jgi:hypothetical protein
VPRRAIITIIGEIGLTAAHITVKAGMTEDVIITTIGVAGMVINVRIMIIITPIPGSHTMAVIRGGRRSLIVNV